MKKLSLQEFVDKHTGKLAYIQLYKTSFGPANTKRSPREKDYSHKCPIPTCTEAMWLTDYEGFVKGYLATQKLNNRKIT